MGTSLPEFAVCHKTFRSEASMQPIGFGRIERQLEAVEALDLPFARAAFSRADGAVHRIAIRLDRQRFPLLRAVVLHPTFDFRGHLLRLFDMPGREAK